MQQIEKTLLTADEASKRLETMPLSFEIENDKQILVYVCGNHSIDKNNIQYDRIRGLLAKFILKVDNHQALIIVEGGERGSNYDSSEDAILKGSEGSFVSYIASKSNIKDICVEPDLVELSLILGERHPKRYVAFFWFAIYADSWHRSGMKDKISFDHYVNERLKHDEKNLGWDNVDFSLEGMKPVFAELFKDRKFDQNDGQIFYDLANPFNNLNIINTIGFEMGVVRDSTIVKGIIEYWNQGYSLFIPYGTGHAVTQEKALRKFLIQKR